MNILNELKEYFPGFLGLIDIISYTRFNCYLDEQKNLDNYQIQRLQVIIHQTIKALKDFTNIELEQLLLSTKDNWLLLSSYKKHLIILIVDKSMKAEILLIAWDGNKDEIFDLLAQSKDTSSIIAKMTPKEVLQHFIDIVEEELGIDVTDSLFEFQLVNPWPFICH